MRGAYPGEELEGRSHFTTMRATLYPGREVSVLLMSGARFVRNQGARSPAGTPTTVETASSASSSHSTWRTIWLLAQTLDDDPLQLHKCWFRMGCRGERRNGNRRWWRGGGGEVVCRVRSVRRPASCDAGPNNKPQQSVTIDLTRIFQPSR